MFSYFDAKSLILFYASNSTILSLVFRYRVIFKSIF
jgi:hypothetical protein